MSEPKIREFLENFDVQISSGSVSNILTKTADTFAGEFDAIVHAGRHYEKLSPVTSRHKNRLDSFLDHYWDYYHLPHRYRDGPTEELAKMLRKEFDELFLTQTG